MKQNLLDGFTENFINYQCKGNMRFREFWGRKGIRETYKPYIEQQAKQSLLYHLLS